MYDISTTYQVIVVVIIINYNCLGWFFPPYSVRGGQPLYCSPKRAIEIDHQEEEYMWHSSKRGSPMKSLSQPGPFISWLSAADGFSLLEITSLSPSSPPTIYGLSNQSIYLNLWIWRYLPHHSCYLFMGGKRQTKGCDYQALASLRPPHFPSLKMFALLSFVFNKN